MVSLDRNVVRLGLIINMIYNPIKEDEWHFINFQGCSIFYFFFAAIHLCTFSLVALRLLISWREWYRTMNKIICSFLLCSKIMVIVHGTIFKAKSGPWWIWRWVHLRPLKNCTHSGGKRTDLLILCGMDTWHNDVLFNHAALGLLICEFLY